MDVSTTAAGDRSMSCELLTIRFCSITFTSKIKFTNVNHPHSILLYHWHVSPVKIFHYSRNHSPLEHLSCTGRRHRDSFKIEHANHSWKQEETFHSRGRNSTFHQRIIYIEITLREWEKSCVRHVISSSSHYSLLALNSFHIKLIFNFSSRESRRQQQTPNSN